MCSIDGANRPVVGAFGIIAPGATSCGYTELAPGAMASWVILFSRFRYGINQLMISQHRSPSLDHNILSKLLFCQSVHLIVSRLHAVSGRLILMMEDGSEYLLDRPGDVVIQKGTMHAWRNPGPDVARWVAVIVDAEPAVVNGEQKLASTERQTVAEGRN
jgi:hypothetical protein